MDVNVVVFILGCVVVAASLLYSVYANKNMSDDSYLSSTSETQHNNAINNLNKKYTNELDILKKEIYLIKNELSTVLEILNTNLLTATLEEVSPELKGDKSRETISSFSNILNYSKFVSKNKDIIDRYKSSKSIEEIAKELNKSITEVEMVVKLIK